MITISTSSIAMGSAFSDSCYRVIGDNIRKIKNYFTESTDTINIVEMDMPIVDSISLECLKFCDLHNLNFVLAECLKEARNIFSNILNLTAELDYFRDDNSENTEHVVIRVEVKSPQKIAFEEYDKIVCWMAENITPDQSEYFTIIVCKYAARDLDFNPA